MADLQDLDDGFRPAAEWILGVANAYLGGATVTSARRGKLKQWWLHTTRGGHQVCRAGTSTHEAGLALDLVVADGSDSQAQRWLGWVWNRYVAPTWSALDPVHFAAVRGCLPTSRSR